MKARILYLTEYDYERLDLLLDYMNRTPQNWCDDLTRLMDDLATCQIVAPEAMPSNIVTLHSTVRYLDLGSNNEHMVTLVFPSNADLSAGRISIAAPLGTAILGHAKGDLVSWETFDGTKTIYIKEVLYHPEAAHDYHLYPLSAT
jgi:regulator of nucleoside diphosphate kinase